jgi:hypothetical protein
MSYFPEACARCGVSPMRVSIMSRFNLDTICPRCEAREKRHPQYAEAARIEEAAVRAGNYNFQGVGAPPDLYKPEMKP